jgi:hypothetical protein
LVYCKIATDVSSQLVSIARQSIYILELSVEYGKKQKWHRIRT